jgi:hypothetical protein
MNYGPRPLLAAWIDFSSRMLVQQRRRLDDFACVQARNLRAFYASGKFTPEPRHAHPE